jgi:hypothetical protein
MFRLVVFLFCVCVSTLAAARDRSTATAPVNLAVTPATCVVRLTPIDPQLRIETVTGQAQTTVFSALEQAQHLGSKYRGWLWVTPSVGLVYGASLRIDFR